ncbi:MAG: glycosyltransferase [Planctomycetota bacterium]
MTEHATAAHPRVSLVVPMHDEEDNVVPLLEEVEVALASVAPFEVLMVDDCSKDDTLERLRAFKAAGSRPWLRIVRLRRQVGQSGAVLAGVEQARSHLVATLDGDRQNDPLDVPRLLALVESGQCDGATGVRVRRQDTWVRKVSSRIGNRVRNWITGDRVTDAACGVKVLPRAVFLKAPRFNGMHRFMPTLMRYLGLRILEVPVNHRARAAGRAKYGIGNRALRGLRDCFAVRWYRQRVVDPSVEAEW